MLRMDARDVLRTGRDTAPWITVDDTGARHTAKNGVCDAFLGLMITCAKQAIRFWDFLGARLAVPGAASVPPLPALIRSG